MNSSLDFSYEHYALLKKQSSGLRLLSADHLPLLASFFYRTFIRTNQRSVPYQTLIGLLDQHLQDINEQYAEPRYPKSARAYIDDWINLKGGYLRKFMPAQGDEPACDLLPDVEKALRWLEELQGRRFVGTESRLKLVLEQIRQLAHDTSADRESKLEQLKQQKAQLEQQISAVEQGLDPDLSNTQILERLFLIADMSRQLLGDFRRIDANFRQLDQSTRKQITLGGLHKGQVLEEVFSGQDVIDDSDEGRSFSAFFELLMSPQMRQSVREDLRQLLAHPAVRPGAEQALSQQDELLQHLYTYLLDAGQQVNQTRQLINEQLRRYIQEQSQDNRRILTLIRQFEAGAQQAEIPARAEFARLDGFGAEISAQLSRRLFQPSEKESLDSSLPEANASPEVDMQGLFELSQVDEQQLLNQISHCLGKHQGQATLAQVASQFPLEQGLDEVLTYLKLASEQVLPAHIDTGQSQTLSWQPEPGVTRRFTVPLITFTRSL